MPKKKRPATAQDEIGAIENINSIPDVSNHTKIALTALYYISLDAQVQNILQEKERLKNILKDYVGEHGTEDGNGHLNLVVDYGNVEIKMQQQKRTTTNYKPDAIETIKEKFPAKVASLLVRSEPVLAGKDVLLNLYEQGKITTRQLNSVLEDEQENYAFQPVKIKPKQYE